MRHMFGIRAMGKFGLRGTVLVAGVATCLCQEPPPVAAQPNASSGALVQELQAQVKELRGVIARMEARMDSMQAETTELKNELRASVPSTPTDPAPAMSVSASSALSTQRQPEDRIAKLAEDQQLLEEKVNDQYQTKVESASKYRVRLSGIALLNLFENRGAVENIDVPTWARARGALDSNGSFGATVRQSMVGLEVYGPELVGAKTRGEIQLDFFGTLPNVSNGITAGGMRLRTATVRLDWKNTSIIAGQDTLFFSPLSPTSFASLAEPAFSYSGNLWTWTPQIRVEHQFHFTETAGVVVQGGILDPLTGEAPTADIYRSPQGGERSGQPAFAGRVAWTQNLFGRPLTVGAGAYSARQNWGFGRTIDAWAGTADWSIPLGRWFTFSGEFYRGSAIGGLGAALGRSVLYNGSLAGSATSVVALNTIGGWGQIGFQPMQRLEFNGAFGDDNPFAEDFRYYPGEQSYFNFPYTRNRSALVNVIYHPRSNLLLSLEYRRLWTFPISGSQPYRADHINLGMGVLF